MSFTHNSLIFTNFYKANVEELVIGHLKILINFKNKTKNNGSAEWLSVTQFTRKGKKHITEHDESIQRQRVSANWL